MRLALLCLGATCLAGQDAGDLLRQAIETYRSANTLHFDCITEGELSSRDQRSWSRTRDVLAKDGDRIRMETEGTHGSYIVVTNGEAAWIASSDTREFIRTAPPVQEVKNAGSEASAAVSSLKRSLSAPDRLAQFLRKAEIVGTEQVEVGNRRVSATVIRADYDPPKGSVGIESWVRTFWIDTERGVIVRDESVTRGKLFPSRPHENAESRHTRRCSAASINEPVDPKLFVFDPPKTYVEMDKLERAYPRPAKQLIGTPAPELTDGNIKLSDYRGKLVLLNFWATWCQPCRTQMPRLAKMYQSLKDQGVVLLGVNDDEKTETAQSYLKEHGYDWPSLYDGKMKDARAKYKVDAIPTLVLIDRQGLIAAYEIGAGEAAESAIRSALAKQGIVVQ